MKIDYKTNPLRASFRCLERSLWYTVLLLLCLQSSAYAQGNRLLLHGQVQSAADGQALVGAKVAVPQRRVTYTDQQGQFTLWVPIDSSVVLTVSHLGYKTLKYNYSNGKGKLLLQLEPLTQVIEEVDVVYTGYQQLSKERATGSFVQVDSALLSKRVGTGILERLEGLVPGLQVDKRQYKPIYNIRGFNSLRSNLTSPLIVLDNFPYEGNLDAIDPSTIASITILKDAAAASIWGARAGNGVIVINTKKLLAGAKQQFYFNANYRLANKDDLYYNKSISSSDFIAVEQFLYDKGYYSPYMVPSVAKYFVFSPVVNLLEDQSKGLLTAEQLRTALDAYRQQDYRDDLLAYFYQKPLLQQYQLGTSGGNDLVQYRFSLGYYKQTGNVKYAATDWLNIGMSNNWQWTKQLQTTIKLNLSKQFVRAGGLLGYPLYPGGYKVNLYPYASLVGPDGQGLPTAQGYNMQYTQEAASKGLLDWSYVALDELQNNPSKNDLNSIQASMITSYTLSTALKLNLLYQYDQQGTTQSTNNKASSFFTRNLYNLYAYSVDNKVLSNIPYGDIFTQTVGSLESHRVRGQLDYKQRFAQQLDFVALAGAELSQSTASSNTKRLYGYDEDVWRTLVIDYKTSYPLYDGLGGSQTIPFADGIDGTVNRYVSLFANGALNYGERYGLTFSARRDATNLYGVATNQKWKPLWSAGILWDMAKERFLANGPFAQLKWRATIGHSGNIYTGGSNRSSIIYANNAPLTQLPYARVQAPPNPSLKWEDVRMINVGIDFRLKNKLLYGAIEWFTKQSTDLISSSPIDPTTGFTALALNVGELRGHGFDVQLGSTIRRADHQLGILANFSMAKDRVVQYYGTAYSGRLLVTSAGGAFTTVVGKPVYPVYSYRFAGLDPSNGDPQGLLDGEISTDYNRLLNASVEDLDYHGQGIPLLYGNLSLDYSYRNWSLYVNIGYKFDYYFRKETINYFRLFDQWVGNADYSKRWQNPGDELTTTVPSLVYPAIENRDIFYANSSANILPGDLVRLQDIRLAYRFTPYPKTSMQLFVNVANVGLLWRANKEGLDPGINFLPVPRSYAVGLAFSL